MTPAARPGNDGRPGNDDRGAVLVMVSLFMIVVLGIAAFAIDLGNARQHRLQAQAAADMAVLAGVQELSGVPSAAADARAVDRVKAYALANFAVPVAAWNACDSARPIPTGWRAPDAANVNRCILINADNTEVQVTRLPAKAVGTFFGGVLGITSLDVSAGATARIDVNGVSPCGLCVLDPGGVSFDLQNGTLTVLGAAGIGLNGNGTISSVGYVTSPGGTILYNNRSVNRPDRFSVAPTSSANSLLDPLRTLPTPIALDPSLATAAPGNHNLCPPGGVTPGVYRQIPRNCTLNAGTYVITGRTDISGQDVIEGDGVTLYLTCGDSQGRYRPCTGAEPPSQSPGVTCGGSSLLRVTAPTAGPLKGVAVFIDRNAAGDFDCRGNGNVTTGTLYGARSTMQLRGGGSCTYDSLVVIARVRWSGAAASCTVIYDPEKNAKAAPAPAGLTW